MSTDGLFDIASGTITGRAHTLAGRCNQDAFAVRSHGPHLVAIVADGCGSGARSEVGAELGARIVAGALLRRLSQGASPAPTDLLEEVRVEALEALRAVARAASTDLREAVSDLLLFTVVGFVVTPDVAFAFSLGDGLIAVNKYVIRLGPFPGNEPPYLAYGLSGQGPRFEVHRVIPANRVESLLVATDGAMDLDALAAHPLPGCDTLDTVGPLRQFWSEDRYFTNRDAVRRKLARINRDATRPLWGERRMEKEAGLLDDDTTLIALRRR